MSTGTLRRCARGCAFKNQQVDTNTGLTEFNRLLDRCNGEYGHLRPQGFGDRNQPMPVGIGFDHREYFAVGDQRAGVRIVGTYRLEINMCRRFALHRD